MTEQRKQHEVGSESAQDTNIHDRYEGVRKPYAYHFPDTTHLTLQVYSLHRRDCILSILTHIHTRIV